jgi:hypothetical protein
MFVNNETTSKETNTSFSLKVLEDMNSAKSLEFRTADGESPTSGDRIFERCFDSWYVGELMKDTIGRKGMPDLWTLGRPYRRGICPAELLSRA